jgi:uncharacterized membrane protein
MTLQLRSRQILRADKTQGEVRREPTLKRNRSRLQGTRQRIVANSGINAKVLPDVWSKAVAAMISAIKDGRPGDGFVAAVELRGEQLALHFPPGALNPDELPNKVVEI